MSMYTPQRLLLSTKRAGCMPHMTYFQGCAPWENCGGCAARKSTCSSFPVTWSGSLLLFIILKS